MYKIRLYAFSLTNECVQWIPVCRSTHPPYPAPPQNKMQCMERHTFFHRKKQDFVFSSCRVRQLLGREGGEGWCIIEERIKDTGGHFTWKPICQPTEGTEGFSSFTKENASEHCTTCTAADLVENVGINTMHGRLWSWLANYPGLSPQKTKLHVTILIIWGK